MGEGEDEEESLSVMLLMMMTKNDPVKFEESSERQGVEKQHMGTNYLTCRFYTNWSEMGV
jgi:hypothetical protein